MAVILATVAALGFFLAAMFGLSRRSLSRTWDGAAIGLATGILFAIAMVDLFPEALALAEPSTASYGFLLGFAALYLVEVFTRGHTHHHHPDEDVHQHPVLPFVVGLSLHNLTDGFVIAASDETSRESATTLAGGILVHQLPVGISVAAVLLASHLVRKKALSILVTLALLIPVGASVFWVLPDLPDDSLGLIMAVAAGALVYVVVGHLLPEAQTERGSWRVAVVFPVTMIATAWLLLGVLGHDHSHDEDHAHDDKTHQEHTEDSHEEYEDSDHHEGDGHHHEE